VVGLELMRRATEETTTITIKAATATTATTRRVSITTAHTHTTRTNNTTTHTIIPKTLLNPAVLRWTP
jgi:hypothetical protein